MKKIVIKLSGSAFGMNDAKLLDGYAAFLARAASVCQPVVVAGGGVIARHYINHARASGADESTLDELGIEISRLNARLLIYALKEKAYAHPPKTLSQVRDAVQSGLIVVAGGLHPGQSTNGTAALIAEKIAASEFINATDVEGVYDADPNKNKDARLLKEITLEDLRAMLIRKSSEAGGHDLMDIVALKIIERSRIKTRIIRSETAVLEKALMTESRVGTEIVL